MRVCLRELEMCDGVAVSVCARVLLTLEGREEEVEVCGRT